MRKYNLHLALIFCIILYSACQKHKTYHIDPCEDFDYSKYPEVIPDASVIVYAPFYLKASFNPNNSNEIVFIDIFNDIIYTYNIEAQEKHILYDGGISPSFAPQWGVKNWILLSLGGQVHKIKSNGDSLTLLKSGPAYSPKWNKKADIFFYNTGRNLTIICDENGLPLDSLTSSMFGNWQHDSLMVLNDGSNGIIVYNPATGYRENVNGASHYTGGVGSVQWIDDEQYIEANTLGIFRVNYKTREFFTLPIDVCPSIFYRVEGFSEQSKRLIFTKLEKEILSWNWNTFGYRYSIVTMNTDGTGVEEIVIPE